MIEAPLASPRWDILMSQLFLVRYRLLLGQGFCVLDIINSDRNSGRSPSRDSGYMEVTLLSLIATYMGSG